MASGKQDEKPGTSVLDGRTSNLLIFPFKGNLEFHAASPNSCEGTADHATHARKRLRNSAEVWRGLRAESRHVRRRGMVEGVECGKKDAWGWAPYAGEDVKGKAHGLMAGSC